MPRAEKSIENGIRQQARPSSCRPLQTKVKTLDFILGVERTPWRLEQVRGINREQCGEDMERREV